MLHVMSTDQLLPGYPPMYSLWSLEMSTMSLCYTFNICFSSASPWLGRQSIAGPHVDKQPCTFTSTPTDNLEPPINLTCMSLDCRRKPDYSEKPRTSTGRTCKLHTERPPPRFKTGTFLLLWNNSANHQATVLPNSIQFNLIQKIDKQKASTT